MHIASWERSYRFASLWLLWRFLQMAQYLLSKFWYWHWIDYGSLPWKIVFYTQFNLAAAAGSVFLFRGLLIVVILTVFIQVKPLP